jgi:hypothetical protein
MTVTGLADEAFGDLLAKHGRLTDLKSQLRRSLDGTPPAGTAKATGKPKAGKLTRRRVSFRSFYSTYCASQCPHPEVADITAFLSTAVNDPKPVFEQASGCKCLRYNCSALASGIVVLGLSSIGQCY